MADKDAEKVHQDSDLKATGFTGHKNLADGFKVGGLMPLNAYHHPGQTHSIGIRSHPHGQAIAHQLLGADAVQLQELDESKPLIDLLQEATFGDDISMHYVSDKYALRMLLRKAHCFRLDAETSAMTVDFGAAIARDLEAARHLAIPPFPVTWIEVDNIARLDRCKKLGIRLTETASREGVCTRIGWLIHPATDLHADGYYVTYCTIIGQGVMIAPLAFFWHTDEASPDKIDPEGSDADLQMVCFGLRKSGVGKIDAFPSTTPMHLHYGSVKNHTSEVRMLMLELSGELRHVWGLLLALGAGQLGAETVTKPQALPTGPHRVAKGKPLLPLEHKVLTIKLAKRTTVEKVVAKAITGVKHRWHEVRGHFRTKKNPDGSIKWRIPIKPHARGDERLGKIEKTYKVER